VRAKIGETFTDPFTGHVARIEVLSGELVVGMDLTNETRNLFVPSIELYKEKLDGGLRSIAVLKEGESGIIKCRNRHQALRPGEYLVFPAVET
jgi:hypothetical protein